MMLGLADTHLKQTSHSGRTGASSDQITRALDKVQMSIASTRDVVVMLRETEGGIELTRITAVISILREPFLA